MPRLAHAAFTRIVEAATQFARAQPAIAGLADAFASDPAQERVREGLLVMAASILDQVGRFESSAHRSVADIVAPDLARPFPAATLVELGAASGVVTVPAGAEVTARADARCRFRLSQPVEVSSARLQNCRVDEPRLSLRFTLVTDGTKPLVDSVGSSLRVFIDEPRDSALLLLHHLLAHTARVEVRRTADVTNPIEGIRPFGMAESLVPPLDGVSDGAALVREYFLLPEKFLLLDLVGITGALKPTDTKANVIFRFEQPLPAQVRIGPATFRANCTPAVNLFGTTAEPRLLPPAAASFALRVADARPDQSSVYEVLDVTASNPASGASTRLPPARRFGALPLDDRLPAAFTTKLSDAAEPATVLTLTSPPDRPPVLEPHVVSARILATNGRAGAGVKPGDLVVPGAGLPPGVTVRNVVPTSAYVPAPSPQALALRAFTRGQVPRRDPLHVLRALLYSLVPREAVDETSASALAAKVDSIQAFELCPASNRERTQRGYAARLVIDESPFSGIGDVALFLRVVHELLNARVSVNGFFTTEVRCTKSGARLAWPVERTTPLRGEAVS